MEKFSDVRSFSNFRMNLDSAPELLAPNEGRETVNMIEPNRSGKLTNMKGFEKIMDLAVNSAFVLPSGAVFKCVGTCYDVENSAIYYALCDVTGVPIRMIDPPTPVANLSKHCIIRMLTDSKKLEYVLKAEAYLNFKYNHRVKMSVIEGLLYFTDGYFGSFLNNDFNPPRKINIVKAMAYTTAYNGTDKDTVTMVGNAKYWPAFHPTYVDSAGNPYTVYEVSDATKFADGTAVVAWLHEGTAYGYRFKPATGYGVVIDSFRYGAKYYVVTDRIWTDTVYFSMNKTGHILEYAPDMYFGIDWQVLDRVKWPPELTPSASYYSDTSKNSNNLRNNLFQFAYRWVYDDNEKSVFSPESTIPLPSYVSLLNGTYQTDISTDNDIVVWADTGSMEVVAIELIVRIGNIGNWVIIGRKNKFDNDKNVILTNDIYARFDFYNTEVGIPIDQIESTRPFDAVPIVSHQLEIIEKNRIVDADYYEGFDSVDIDVELTNEHTTPNIGTIDEELTTWTTKQIEGVGNPAWLYYAGLIDMSSFWETGFTYIISIETTPEKKYWDVEGLGVASGYDRYTNKFIKAQAVVDAPVGMNFEDFSNSVCSSLRNGNGIDSAVIAINNYDFAGLGLMTNFIFLSPSPGAPQFPPVGNNIGFIIEQTWNPMAEPHDCEYCQFVTVSIRKFYGSSVSTTFKSGASHPFGLFYMDRASRFCAVGTSDGSKTPTNKSEIYVPSQVELQLSHLMYQNSIKWEINNIPPDWATHYVWAYAKNSSISYSLYASIAYISTAYSINSIFLNVNKYISDQHDTTNKQNISVYEWESGDRIRFVAKLSGSIYQTLPENLDFEIMGVMPSRDTGSGSTYTKDDLGDYITDAGANKVKDTNQNGIIVEYFNYKLYDIDINNTIVEIYRPRKRSDNIVYYSFGEVLPVLNPHTSLREHGKGYLGVDQIVTNGISQHPATGVFKSGDAYLRFRILMNAFPCESFSYSDFFNSECMSIGTINAKNDDEKFTRYISKLLYSGRYIQNTHINDLSRVDSSDCVELPDKYGAINSIEEVGYTLKILQKSKPSSLYIGRAGVTQPSADAKEILSSTKDVLGTLIVHDSDYGTVHPDSVVKVETRYYFFDYYAHAICRDAGNGVKNISEQYNINGFLQEKCRLFGSADNVDVISAYDQANELVLFTFTDKTTDANSFTIAFHDMGGTENDGFVTFMDWDGQPDYYGTAKQTLTSFKGNDLYLHNSDTADRSTFYGTLSKYWVTIVSNKLPLIIKRWMSIFVSSNKKLSCPDAGDVSIAETGNTPGGMTSLIKAGAFTSIEGKYVADFGKNMTTNQTTATYADLVNGDDMEGQAMEVRLEGEESTEHKLLGVELQGVTSKI